MIGIDGDIEKIVFFRCTIAKQGSHDVGRITSQQVCFCTSRVDNNCLQMGVQQRATEIIFFRGRRQVEITKQMSTTFKVQSEVLHLGIWQKNIECQAARDRGLCFDRDRLITFYHKPFTVVDHFLNGEGKPLQHCIDVHRALS